MTAYPEELVRRQVGDPEQRVAGRVDDAPPVRGPIEIVEPDPA